MAKLKTGLWKGICVVLAVPALMALAMPVRALMLDGNPDQRIVASPETAVIEGTVSSFGSVPLLSVTVTGTDENGTVAAMAHTDANGRYVLEIPATAENVTVTPQGGGPAEVEIAAGGTTQLNATVPPSEIVGDSSTPGWWSGLSTTSKAAIIGIPAAAAVAGGGVAIENNNSSSSEAPRPASPVAP
ncbi:MAG TPA: carboxypeptidase-like regulatory domain-containing protein [Planctomycetota bacterium]|nr:carboxypeptidase-like regulatory domain-containing protein [Planctomycetota bacterium]